jgi:hypothetical protein
MKTILINTTTNQPASRVFDGGYKVDGKSVSKEELAKHGLVELEYIDTPHPTTTANQVATSQWQVTESGYERVWVIREKTEQELKQEDWDCPEFEKRVTAPSELAEQLPSIVTYAQVNPDKMSIVPKGDFARVYYNTLKSNHNDIINQLQLIEEPRP